MRYSTNEAAALLNMSPFQIRKMRTLGHLKPSYPKFRKLYDRKDLLPFIEVQDEV